MDHHNAEPIKCEPCNILFDANHKLDLHVRRVHKSDERIFCEKCPRIERTIYYKNRLSYDWHYAKKHIQKDEEGNFACHRCPQHFNQRQVLQIHIKVDHHNQESNKCSVCSMMFALPSRLEYHMKEAHADGPQFSCEFCWQKFNNRKTLQNHRSRKHTNPEFKVFCDQCGKGYRQPNELKVHIARAHSTGEFICEDCGTTFTNQYALKDHKRNFHSSCQKIKPKPQPKKHNCQYCGSKFSSTAKKEVHEKSVHLNIRDIMCDECDYRTANAYKLKMHKEAVHEGIVYKCDVPGCGRSYRTKGSLYDHQYKNHNIPKPSTIEKMKKEIAFNQKQ
jgi:KRAB domain-containing zinc finger protein